MKAFLFISFVLICNLAKAADGKGITFTNKLSWAQIKEKAKKENKYIFLDLYTTWCVPCKIMAKEVFTREKVGEFFNQNFINIAVQLNKTKNDNNEVKQWYKDAEDLKKLYNVRSFPTYLFLNPSGELVHLIVGEIPDADEFIGKAKLALDPKTQFATLKLQYKEGNKNPDFLLNLMAAAKNVQDNDLFDAVANDYLSKQKNLLTKENLELILNVTAKSTDPGYPILLNHSSEIDSLFGIGKTINLINTIGFDETILPILKQGGMKKNLGFGMFDYTGNLNNDVNWQDITSKVKSKYPRYSEGIILSAKPIYYSWLNDWPQFTVAVSDFISSKNKSLTPDLLNMYASIIFNGCNEKQCTDTGLSWLEICLSGQNANNPFYLYTYGKLLYKFGKKDMAIGVIKKAIESDPVKFAGFNELIAQMNKGEKIWP